MTQGRAAPEPLRQSAAAACSCHAQNDFHQYPVAKGA